MSYDFPHINSRLVDSAGQRDHGSNLSPGAILQDLFSNRHEALIEAMSESLLLSPLTAVTHFDSTKHRFDIARESPALGSQLGIDRDLPRRDIEAAVGTDEILHARHVDIFDSGRQIHIGAARLGLHGSRHMGLTASHEPASEPSNRQSFAPLVAEMFQREGGIREDDPVGWGRGLIHESEAALDHVEAIDPELDG